MAGETTTTETTETPQDGDAVFEAAFAQLSAANDAARDVTPPVVDQTPTVKIVEPDTTGPTGGPTGGATGGAPAATGGVTGSTTGPTGGTTGGTPAPTGGAPTAPTPPARMSDDEIARIAAIAAQVQRPQPQPREQQVQQEPSVFSTEEVEFLNNYQNEYPDIARGEALSRRKDILDAVRFIFGEVNKVVRPIEAVAQQLNARTHLGDIQRLVPENRLTREEAIEWTRKQPDFLQPAYFQVIQSGTPEQVAHMTALVRGPPVVNGGGQQPQTNQTNGGGQQPQIAQDPVRDRALAALRPVDTKRTGISTDALESGDFDGAFARFSSMVDAAKR